jgi:thymidylate synthase (FAD)
MKVSLISYSQGPAVLDQDQVLDNSDPSSQNTIENMVAYCARVSNPANQQNTATNQKLLAYLAKHQHWSPFEMVSICLEIETTRDIARQILRHRSFSFQEFSQRYAVVDTVFETREARLQDLKNRQNSVVLSMDMQEDITLANSWTVKQKQVADAAQEAYEWAIENGIAKEQARAVLPEGMTPSRLYMNGTLRSWIHYIQLRSANGTQKEHQEVAVACAEAIAKVYPMIMDYVVQEQEK